MRRINITGQRLKLGRLYSVPCVQMVDSKFHGFDFVPVLGPAHVDKEFPETPEHFHVDWRFVASTLFHGHILHPASKNVIAVGETTYKAVGLQEQSLPYLRQMPDFFSNHLPAFVALEDSQRAKCDHLIDGHICPHKGVDLTPFMVDGKDEVVCPLHFLKWNVKTGALMGHHRTEAP